MRKYFFRILTLVWMIVIFSFSAKTADASSQDSLFIGETIGRLVIADFEDWDAKKKENFAKSIEYPIRKGAHMTEYAVLGILVFFSWNSLKYGIKRTALYSWMITVLYAASDEVHQLFVPGRSGQVTDVLIDSVGAAIGVGLAYILWRKRVEL